MFEQAVISQWRGELDHRIVRPTGEVRWVRSRGVRLTGPNANLVAGTVLDITDRHEADEALAFQATHDWLTGLPNPATLHDKRWTHPDLGDISPGEFIPIAESDRLIGPIGTWVIDRAMQQLAEWHSDPRVSAGLWMAVNVSAQQLSQGRLADRVRESLDRAGVAAEALHLEITESVLMDRVDNALTTIAELDAMGVNLTIDDFGTGYSSLSYLSRLPSTS